MAKNTFVLPDKTYFPNLDGFRTIAFLIVFLGHCFILFDFGERSLLISVLRKFFGRPGIGVNFFFVLSGFLISYLILNEKQRSGRIDVGAFYLRRVLRIWPVYFIVVIVSIGLSLIDRPFYSLHDANFWQISFFLTNINLATPGISSLPLTVLWSVAVEEQFYLMLPLLILFFTRRVFLAFPLLVVASLVFRYFNRHSAPYYLEFHTFSVCCSLFVGCLCAYCVIYHRLGEWFKHLPKKYIIAVYLACFGYHFFAGNDKVLTVFIYALFFAFFILEQNYSLHSFYKMKNAKLLTGWGRYTYGLYAYHMIFISLIMVLIPSHLQIKGNYILYCCCWIAVLVGSLAAAKLSYHFIERPFLRLKEKFSR